MNTLDRKKASALFLVIQKIGYRHQNLFNNHLDNQIGKLLERANKIKFAKTKKEFRVAIADL